jgi:hypothetical protein
LGGGGISANGRKHYRHAIATAEYVMIPEADDPIALSFDQCCPASVKPGIVLTTIDPYDQFGAMTGEIGDEVADRNLPAKAGIREAFPQQAPHPFLGFSGIVTEPSSTLRSALRGTETYHHAVFHVHPTPALPIKGRED